MDSSKYSQGSDIKVDETNGEFAYWYRKESESLLICGVGGKNNFGGRQTV